MKIAIRRFLRAILVQVGQLLCRALVKVTADGIENFPRDAQRLLVISNHFSWFDGPLLSLLLPQPPAYLLAQEEINGIAIRLISIIFESIPIWRGRVDRGAMTTAIHVLQCGGIVGIFPEGSIQPESADVVAAGQQFTEGEGGKGRHTAALIRAKAGVALLATLSGARILPVALIGSHDIMSNLFRRHRTPIRLIIGPAFGPLSLSNEVKGVARRQQLDKLADEMMCQIAQLMPPENRGYYTNVNDNGEVNT